MVNRIREFLKGPAGKVAGVIVCAAAVVLMALVIRRTLGPDQASTWSKERVYVCAETGKPFDHTLTVGELFPVQSPHTGKKTGYPAELCYWTADGQAKAEPTAVLLNEVAGKPGPTFCPDCGRRVVGHNPSPGPGVNPPPTRTEVESRSKGASQ